MTLDKIFFGSIAPGRLSVSFDLNDAPDRRDRGDQRAGLRPVRPNM
jgi:hypothetical protein